MGEMELVARLSDTYLDRSSRTSRRGGLRSRQHLVTSWARRRAMSEKDSSWIFSFKWLAI